MSGSAGTRLAHLAAASTTLTGKLLKLPIQRNQIRKLEVRIQPARIRQNPKMRAAYFLYLKPQPGLWHVESRPVGGYTEHRKHPGLAGKHFFPKPPSSFKQIVPGQLSRRGAGSLKDVGNAITIIEQLRFFPWMQQARRETSAMKGRPEAVTGAGEVMAYYDGVEARVDAAKEHFQIRREQVRCAAAGGGLQLFSARPGVRHVLRGSATLRAHFRSTCHLG